MEPLACVQAVRRANKTIERNRAQNLELLRELRGTSPPSTTLGAHLLALKDPASGKPLTDNQLEGELATFFVAGERLIHAS